MKTKINHLVMLIAILFFAGTTVLAQTSNDQKNENKNQPKMKTYLIEREIPGAGQFTAEQLKGISQKSCSVLTEMGPKIKWIQSYVTGDKIYCIYQAENEDLIREHAKKGGFPANKIVEIANVISPATAEN